MERKNILVLCTGNSCRSQMAEGFIQHYGGDNVMCRSAGLIAKGVNPRAIEVMQEAGIDISAHTSNPIDDYLSEVFDLIITVCDHAKETCPIFPSTTKSIHRSFRDPDGAQGTEEEILDKFRSVRDQISQFSQKLIFSMT